MTKTNSRDLFKNKGTFVFNYKLKKYEHLSERPMSYDIKHLQYLRNKMLKSEW